MSVRASAQLTAGGFGSQDSFALVDALVADLPLLQTVRRAVPVSPPSAPYAARCCRPIPWFVWKSAAAQATW